MYKLRFLVITIALIFTSVTVFAQESTPEATDTPLVVEYTVTADSANLRSGPGTSFEIVGSVTSGDSLLIYDEESEVSGWLRIFRPDEEDAYIADFLVERAPQRFYSALQEPVAFASGRGGNLSDVFDLPRGAYRIDAFVNDNSFILEVITVEGECRDGAILNVVDFDSSQLAISALFVSRGCSVIFQTDNVDGNWTVEIRDILNEEFLIDSMVMVEDGVSISGKGKALTMPTNLPEGLWMISAVVQDRAFILEAHPIGDCEETAVFNELDFDATTLEISSAYRSTDCIVFWETDNVEGEWEITFSRLN